MCRNKYRFIFFSLFFIQFTIDFAQTSRNNNIVNTKDSLGNCTLILKINNINVLNKVYLSGDNNYFLIDSVDIADGIDTLCISVSDPIHLSLYINNNAEQMYEFYLHSGVIFIDADAKTYSTKISSTTLNDEFKEKIRVQDSMYKKYNIIHAMLYPYNKMNSDSAHELLRKYLPLCDSLSEIHINKFYETHPSSFLSLENIFVILQYTFDDPSYDTTIYDLKKLKARFDKLDPSLKRYKMYNECIEMFNKERVKPPEILKPLWDGK